MIAYTFSGNFSGVVCIVIIFEKKSGIEQHQTKKLYKILVTTQYLIYKQAFKTQNG